MGEPTVAREYRFKLRREVSAFEASDATLNSAQPKQVTYRWAEEKHNDNNDKDGQKRARDKCRHRHASK
ncbi:hypothetical protein BGLA2_1170024 [Burkholderia gladioli]|nr:hypothetical protein BGLA2_1170024 [Burkholderia gladioli]